MNFFNVDKEVITEAGKEDAPSITEIDEQVVSDEHENIEDLPSVEEKVTHKSHINIQLSAAN